MKVREIVDFFKRRIEEETPEFLQKKLEDHRSFSGAMYVLGAVLGTGLWVWDYVTDPAGAFKTLHLRPFFLIFLIAPYLFRHIRNGRLLAVLLVTLTILTEVLYLHILTKLHMGMVYGIGGFMYYMMLPPLAFQAFSLRTSIIYVVIAVTLPHILALLGFAPGFEHLHYAILLWPAAVLAILIQFIYAKTYSERYLFERELERLSYTDPLSGLCNRRSFMERLQEELHHFERTGIPFSLLVVDIDHFKSVNDTYGHQAGDRAILAVSSRIRHAVRSKDIAARIGGEEFAVILPESDAPEALKIAERIRRTVEAHPFEIDGKEVRITVSIGAATARKSADASTLFKKADDAMYLAKRSGRNRVEMAG